MNDSPDAYAALVRSGFVGSLKRDVLLEASTDLEYLSAIRYRFTEAGEQARQNATACTVQLVEELISKGLCSLATWEGTGHKQLKVDRSELVKLVEKTTSPTTFHEYFLLSTPAGNAWVERYMKLEQEL